MPNKSFTISIIILLTTIIGVFLVFQRGQPVVIEKNLKNLPMEIIGLNATEDSFSESVYKELNADIHVYRHYRGSFSPQVDLYIGYYGTAKGGRTGHNPYACLPGAGWGIMQSYKVKLAGKNYPDGVAVNYILTRKGDKYEIILHWYQSARYKVLSTGVHMNIQRFASRLFHNRNDGAFVRVSAFSVYSKTREAELLVKSFAVELLNLLPEYWPVEK